MHRTDAQMSSDRSAEQIRKINMSVTQGIYNWPVMGKNNYGCKPVIFYKLQEKLHRHLQKI